MNTIIKNLNLDNNEEVIYHKDLFLSAFMALKSIEKYNDLTHILIYTNKTENAELVKKYIDWGAGPRASQNLILGAKANAAIHGKFSPDIEDVQAVAYAILKHRIVKNYKAEAEGITEKQVIEALF